MNLLIVVFLLLFFLLFHFLMNQLLKKKEKLCMEWLEKKLNDLEVNLKPLFEESAKKMLQEMASEIPMASFILKGKLGEKLNQRIREQIPQTTSQLRSKIEEELLAMLQRGNFKRKILLWIWGVFLLGILLGAILYFL